MRILFVSRYFIDDLQTKVHGVYKRMGMFIEALKEIATLDVLFYTPPGAHYSPSQTKELETRLRDYWQADVSLFLCPMREYGDRTHFGKISSFGKGVFSIFEQLGYYEVSGEKQVGVLDDCLESNPDAVFAHRLSAMCTILRTEKPLPPVFFDFDDIEHIVLSRHIGQQKKLKSKLLYLLLPALLSGERKAVRLAAQTYVCSEKDRETVARESSRSSVYVIPNSVSIPDYKPPAGGPTLLFLGSDYSANLDAVEYLTARIWPLVYGADPDARLLVTGIPPEKLSGSARKTPGVEITGFVKDLDKLYEKSSVVVTPLLVGGGTRYKIIEAAAYGRPVVSTSVGSEGIEFANNKEILVRDDPGDFASACSSLLRDPALCEAIGLRARQKTIGLYDRDSAIRGIREHIAAFMKSNT